MDISTNGNVYLTAACLLHIINNKMYCVTIFPRGLAYFVLSVSALVRANEVRWPQFLSSRGI